MLFCLITNFPPEALRETNSDKSERLGPSLTRYPETMNQAAMISNPLHKKDHISSSDRTGAWEYDCGFSRQVLKNVTKLQEV